MSRFYYYVVRSGQEWEVKFDNQTERFAYKTQAEAIDAAANAAKTMWEKGDLSGVRIQGADNKWRDERTYGEDPYPPIG